MDTSALVRRTHWRLAWVGGFGNALGASVVMLFLLYLAPGAIDDEHLDDAIARSIPIFAVYMAIAVPLGGWRIQFRPFGPIALWLASGREATAREQELVLRYPRNWALKTMIPWVGGTVIYPLINIDLGADLALTGGAVILLAGLTAAALQYLLVERILRPITALALAGGPPPRLLAPGVSARLTIAWALATGIPVIGIAAISLAEITGVNLDQDRVDAAALSLAVAALVVGLAMILIAARAVSDPLDSMREALRRVEGGDVAAQVPVDDGSEVGLLQAGFNRMTRSLAERERLRDAFGAFVDPSLTERVLAEGTDLAGEQVELSLLFMDVRGFTSFSEKAAATDIVAMLNDLYGAVVPIILRHGGHANKFIGDGLLAIFGAPERLDDHADRAVAAAAEIAAAVGARYSGELRVGVGVNSGSVVVGTIGGGGRLDFTVIGDPVNTAARVESVTRQTGDDLLITEATRSKLRNGSEKWVERPSIPLKGKAEVVRLWAPR